MVERVQQTRRRDEGFGEQTPDKCRRQKTVSRVLTTFVGGAIRQAAMAEAIPNTSERDSAQVQR